MSLNFPNKRFFFFFGSLFFGFHYYFFGQKVKTLNLMQVPRYGFSQKAKYESQTLSFIPGSQQHTLSQPKITTIMHGSIKDLKS